MTALTQKSSWSSAAWGMLSILSLPFGHVLSADRVRERFVESDALFGDGDIRREEAPAVRRERKRDYTQGLVRLWTAAEILGAVTVEGEDRAKSANEPQRVAVAA